MCRCVEPLIHDILNGRGAGCVWPLKNEPVAPLFFFAPSSFLPNPSWLVNVFSLTPSGGLGRLECSVPIW